jgi:hypothetical protein
MVKYKSYQLKNVLACSLVWKIMTEIIVGWFIMKKNKAALFVEWRE